MKSNLSGLWSGVYWQVGRPTQFEMHMTETDGVLFGSIRDLRFIPREATLSGDHGAGHVTFEKRYRDHSGPLLRYRGSVSADCKSMEGTWRLHGILSSWGRGRWKAWRRDDERELDISQEIEREISE